jgi:hypothetical protein
MIYVQRGGDEKDPALYASLRELAYFMAKGRECHIGKQMTTWLAPLAYISKRPLD